MRCLFVFDFVYAFFPLTVKLIGLRTGRQFFKKCRFFRHLNLKIMTLPEKKPDLVKISSPGAPEGS